MRATAFLVAVSTLWTILPPSLAADCCVTNAARYCDGVEESACDDDGKCFCCPNGGGIDLDPTSGDCSCGNRQTCTDTCKGLDCGPHGVCSGFDCVCDEGWRGFSCDEPTTCCTSSSAPDSLCNAYEAHECIGDTCYCCPQADPISLNTTTGSCFCAFSPTCEFPPPDPCEGIHCGEHATCRSGVCECVFPWTDLKPATNSCLALGCVTECGINANCNNGTCDCLNGFSGDLCQTFLGPPGHAPDLIDYSGPTTTVTTLFAISVGLPGMVLTCGTFILYLRRKWVSGDSSDSSLKGSGAGAGAGAGFGAGAGAAAATSSDYQNIDSYNAVAPNAS